MSDLIPPGASAVQSGVHQGSVFVTLCTRYTKAEIEHIRRSRQDQFGPIWPPHAALQIGGLLIVAGLAGWFRQLRLRLSAALRRSSR